MNVCHSSWLPSLTGQAEADNVAADYHAHECMLLRWRDAISKQTRMRGEGGQIDKGATPAHARSRPGLTWLQQRLEPPGGIGVDAAQAQLQCPLRQLNQASPIV